MLGLAGFIGGIFALVGSVVVGSVAVALLFALLIPLLVFCILFRIGFALMRFAAMLVLLCVVVVWLL
jgi:hypothetical protein